MLRREDRVSDLEKALEWFRTEAVKQSKTAH